MALSVVLLTTTGCWWRDTVVNLWQRNAFVDDRIIASPRNVPPVFNDMTYEVIAVDGHGFKRALPPMWIPKDYPEEVWVHPGSHDFTISILPTGRRPTDVAKIDHFRANVEAGKTYLLTKQNKKFVLIEAHLR